MVTLEILVKRHSQSLKMATYDRSHTSSYWRSAVTKALTGPILYHFQDKARYCSKIMIFSYHLHSSPPSRNIAITLGTEKVEWRGYQIANKQIWRYFLLVSIHERDRWTLHDSIGHAIQGILRQKFSQNIFSSALAKNEQEVKVIWQKAPHGGPIPRLGVTPGGRKLYHWIPGVGFPISVPWAFKP